MDKQRMSVVSEGVSPLLYGTSVTLVLDLMPAPVRLAFDEDVERKDAELAERKLRGFYLGPGLENHLRNLRDTGKAFHQIGAVELWRIVVKYLPISDSRLKELDTLTLEQAVDYWNDRVLSLRGEANGVGEMNLRQQAA